jgi:hypothetical protein
MKTDDIEKLLNLENKETQHLYMTWDKGDCSLIGLARILLIQEINKEIKIRGVHYDGQYNELLNCLYNKYNT